MPASSNKRGKPGIFARYLPILHWLPAYKMSWLGPDIIAGLTIWAVMVPEAMAYAGIAGVPPIVGLYAVPLPLIAYALFGTSRTMIIGPDSATALISGTTVAAVVAASSGGDPVVLTAGMALAVGVIFLVLGLFRMGWVANFIPEPAMKGFIQGLVWVTIIGQVPKIFGVEGGSGNFFQKTWEIFEKLPTANMTTTMVGLASLGLLLVLKRFLPRVPSALTVAVIGILAVSVLGLDKNGVEIVGTLKAGLPALGIPKIGFADLQAIITGAFAIVLLGYAESLGAAKAAATRGGGNVDPNQELVAHGPANIGTALSGGFVVVGSLSKTSIAMGAGGKTPVTSLVCALFVILTLLFLMPLFKNLPHATLAAIVIEAMLGLADFAYLKRLRGINRVEFRICMLTLFGVLTLGVLPGIGMGVVVALLFLIYRASSPATSELGKLPGKQVYRSVVWHPEAQTVPGLLIYRVNASPVFFNANHFADELKKRIEGSEGPVKTVLVDLETAWLIDTTAMGMLVDLKNSLSASNVALTFANVRDEVKDVMGRSGVLESIGTENLFDDIQLGVDAFGKAQGLQAP